MGESSRTQILDKLIKHSLEMHCAIGEDGRFVAVSDGCKKLLGYEAQELEGESFIRFVHPDDEPATVVAACSVMSGSSTTAFENRYIHKNGKPLSLSWSANWSAEDNVIFCTARKAHTATPPRLKKIIESELYKQLIRHGGDMAALLDAAGNYLFVGGATSRYLGYEPEQLVGLNVFALIHPEDVPKVKRSWARHRQKTSIQRAVFRFMTDNGSWRWLEATISNQLHNPAIGALIVNSRDVTERIQTRQELEKLALVASHTTNGVIITDNRLRIEWVNDSFTRLTGYSPEEVLGKRTSEFLHSHETDNTALAAASASLQQGQPASYEILIRKKNGDACWLAVQVNPVQDQNEKTVRFITIQSDITEKKKAQFELERLSLVASGIDNGVIITDAQGQTEWINEGFTKMTGYTLAEMLGKKPGDLLRGEETDEATSAILTEKLKQGIHFNSTLLNYRKSGEKYWVSMDITPIRNSTGSITHFIAIQKDITFRKEAEAKLLKMADELYAQNTDLQQFTYIVSHNLRAPVTNVLGLSSLLSSSDKNSEVFDTALTYLKQSVEQIDTVLKDMHVILSIRDRQDILDKKQVLLPAVVEQAYEHLQDPLQLSGGTFECILPKDLAIQVNSAYLYSVLCSLLSNAIKFRSPERPLQVKLTYHPHPDGGHELSLADNGLGFDTQKAGDKVFRLYKTFHRQPKGRGFGLFLAKTHVEAMGGRIEVQSQENKGTTFRIYLPA